jgi:hypothetical protein
MTFALYRFGTLIARYPSWRDAMIGAEERGMGMKVLLGIVLADGVEVRDITDQVDLEEAIAKA